MPIVTINDYADFPQQRHPFSRQCPNLRTCWPGLSRSFNAFDTNSRPEMLRRIAFILILGLRFLHTLFFAYYMLFATFFSALPVTMLNTLFFFFVAWNLHLIIEMSGERMVFGRRFGRSSFDLFLAAMLVAHLWVVPADIWLGIGGWSIVWTSFDLMILGVAWVATWDPEDGGLTLP
jgi:hypothetical protein